MGLFKRGTPRDTSALFGSLTQGSYTEFEREYDPRWVDYQYSTGSLLSLALSNGDQAARVAIASRLLDDGIDVRAGVPLHVMGSLLDHDFANEPALLARMLDAGADVNLVEPKFGTPLQAFAQTFKLTDEMLAPFYDVFFARDDLDLLQPGMSGRPVFLTLLKWREHRADLVSRATDYLTARGIAVPEPID